MVARHDLRRHRLLRPHNLLLASGLWIGPPVLPIVITLIFAIGVALLIVALMLEFVEMSINLRAIAIEMRETVTGSRSTRD